MGERAALENDRGSLRNDDLAVDRAASFLRTRPPVDEEGEEVGCADGAVVVERSKKPRPVQAGGVMVGTGRLALFTGRGPS